MDTEELDFIFEVTKKMLSVEILYSAMNSLIEGETKTIKDALQYGIDEWEK